MLDVTFYGVRGSTPCSGPGVAHYGGNTSCVLVEGPGIDPILCDLGTGVRYYGAGVAPSKPFRGTALVSHLHWDHIQGFPFFTPILRPGAELEIVGPKQERASLADALSTALSPPLFPIGIADMAGSITFREISEGSFEVGAATIEVFPVVHVGPTNGYRITAGGVSVVYISDYQQPQDGSLRPDPEVVERCRGADLLIHDSQYDPEEFAVKRDWGHCTVEFAVEVARRAEVGRLALYHHDPGHDDGWVTRATEQARADAGGAFEVLAAREGETVQVRPPL